MKKKYVYVIGAIILVLVITNPSYSSFKAYLGDEEARTSDTRRTTNLFICSKYSANDRNFFAIAGNFIELERTKLHITELREDIMRQLADSALYWSDTSDSNHNKISASEFAQRIKAKYPVYENIPNDSLIRAVIKKYPIYTGKVDFAK